MHGLARVPLEAKVYRLVRVATDIKAPNARGRGITLRRRLWVLYAASHIAQRFGGQTVVLLNGQLIGQYCRFHLGFDASRMLSLCELVRRSFFCLDASNSLSLGRLLSCGKVLHNFATISFRGGASCAVPAHAESSNAAVPTTKDLVFM